MPHFHISSFSHFLKSIFINESLTKGTYSLMKMSFLLIFHYFCILNFIFVYNS